MILRSTDYANLKAKEGWCGNWLFFSTLVGRQSMWNAYDPDANRWHPLPTFPKADCESVIGCSCVSICKRFLVIGGRYSLSPRALGTNDVMMFDPYKQQWSNVSSMQTARSNFACAVIGNKVYVAGGNNSNATEGLSSAEVYDPYTDRWEELPPMPFPLLECLSVSHGGKFHVVGKKGSNFEYDTYVIFNTTNRKWQIVEGPCPFSKLSRDCTTMADGRIYTIHDDNIVRVINTDTGEWSPLGVFPAIALPHHTRPLKPFSFCFIGFRHYLYVVGGMALRFDSATRTYDIVELNTVTFCDPTTVPLEWRDARPMLTSSGSIVGCALVEE